MRKISLILFIVFVMIFFTNMTAFAKDNPPAVSADGVVIMDGQTGQVLYSKNPNTPYPPASTTKIMTALLTLENCSLDDKVTVSKNAASVDPSSSRAGLRENEELTIKDLLYGLQFVSGNDCALALAEHVGGSVDNFSEMMNKRAEELGCKNTNFVNPNGLYDDNHRTTAFDLALIMRELVKHPEYSEIATDPVTYSITPSNMQGLVHKVSNENKMVCNSGMYHLDGFEGGKTGYTIQSLHSYVASASRNGQRFIVTWMHAKPTTHYDETIKLMNYAFNNFETKKLYSKGDIVTNCQTDSNNTIPLVASEDFYYLTDKGSSQVPVSEISKDLDLSKKSFSKDDIVTEASILLDGKSIGKLKLASGEDHLTALSVLSSVINSPAPVSKPNIFLSVLKFIFMTILILILLFAAVILTIRFFVKRKRRKMKRQYIMDNFYKNQ